MIATYPESTGWKTDSPPTSKAAGLAVEDRAATLREQAYGRLVCAPCTADEVAEELHESVLAIRPRLSELRAQGRIEPTGERRKNASGHSAAVWQAVRIRRQGELAL
jgi:predicted ArsR family transcriptional regulator